MFRSGGSWHATNPYYWSQVVECGWCAGVWTAIIVWAAYLVYPDIVVWLTPLAIAQLASMLHDRS